MTGQVAGSTFVSVIAIVAAKMSRRFKMNRNMTASGHLDLDFG
jgi:hypothetical protein